MLRIRNTSQQQKRWTIPEAVVTVICSWWWANTSPITCRAVYCAVRTESLYQIRFVLKMLNNLIVRVCKTKKIFQLKGSEEFHFLFLPKNSNRSFIKESLRTSEKLLNSRGRVPRFLYLGIRLLGMVNFKPTPFYLWYRSRRCPKLGSGPEAGLHAVGEDIKPRLFRESNQNFSGAQPVAYCVCCKTNVQWHALRCCVRKEVFRTLGICEML